MASHRPNVQLAPTTENNHGIQDGRANFEIGYKLKDYSEKPVKQKFVQRAKIFVN